MYVYMYVYLLTYYEKTMCTLFVQLVQLGGVPLLALRKDMSNTMPNEKVQALILLMHVHDQILYMYMQRKARHSPKADSEKEH